MINVSLSLIAFRNGIENFIIAKEHQSSSTSNFLRPVSLLESKSSASMISPLRKDALENATTNGSMLRTMSYSSHFLPSYSAKVRSVINSAETKALFSSHEKLLNWKANKDIDQNYSVNEGINKITNLQSGLLKIMSSSVSSPKVGEQNTPSSPKSISSQEENDISEGETKLENYENTSKKRLEGDEESNDKSSSDYIKLPENQEKHDESNSVAENRSLSSRELLPSSSSPVNVDELLDWDIDNDEEEQFYSFNSIDLQNKTSILASMTREQRQKLLEKSKKAKHKNKHSVNNGSPLLGKHNSSNIMSQKATINGNINFMREHKDSMLYDNTKSQLINTVKCIEATAGLDSKDCKLFSINTDSNVWQDNIGSLNINGEGCAKESENDRVTSILKSAIIDSSNSLINSFLQHNNESPYHKASTSSSVVEGGNCGRMFDDWSRRTSASVSSTFSGRENRAVDIDLLDLYCDDELHPSLEHDPNMQLFIAHTPSPNEDDIDTGNNDISRPYLTDRGNYLLTLKGLDSAL